VLLAALAQTIHRWTGEERVAVALEGHGREDLFAEVDVSRTVGWFTTVYPVVLEVSAAMSTGERLKAVKEQLRRVPQKGIGYGALRYLSEVTKAGREVSGAGLAEDCELSFNYLGQFDQVIGAEKVLAVAREGMGAVKSGRQRRSHLVEVSAAVIGGQLQIMWDYSSELHKVETMRQVSNWYAEELEEVIRHCKREDAGGFTPSDFPNANLTQKDLDKLVAKLNKLGEKRSES
jgi:non-ribosomal peptide synthase protein (TIGR01720 family)